MKSSFPISTQEVELFEVENESGVVLFRSLSFEGAAAFLSADEWPSIKLIIIGRKYRRLAGGKMFPSLNSEGGAA
jgi:hypothetical protein